MYMRAGESGLKRWFMSLKKNHWVNYNFSCERVYQRKTQILTFCTGQTLITPIATIHTDAVDMVTRVILETLSTDFTAVCTIRFITAV